MHKKVARWWHHRRHRFYKKNRWHLVLDFSLGILVILLAAVSIRLAIYHPDVIAALNFFHQPVVSKRVISADFQLSNSPKALKLGQVIPLSFSYTNNSPFPLQEVDFSFNFSNSDFALTSLSTKKGEIKEGNILVLKDIKPGEKIDTEAELSWKNKTSNYPRSISGKIVATASSGGQQLIQEASWTPIKINSQLTLKADIYYYSPQGDQLGIGPVPPVVGIPTTYWLVLRAHNDGNEVKDIVVTAQLPAEVELSGDRSLLSGDFSYNKDDRRLIWQIPKMAASNGDYIANFGITFTPNAKQVGHDVVLIKSIAFHGKDDYTGQELSGSLANLDTSLPSDRIERGNGKVVEP